jgi:hypothetical protein
MGIETATARARDSRPGPKARPLVAIETRAPAPGPADPAAAPVRKLLAEMPRLADRDRHPRARLRRGPTWLGVALVVAGGVITRRLGRAGKTADAAAA